MHQQARFKRVLIKHNVPDYCYVKIDTEEYLRGKMDIFIQKSANINPFIEIGLQVAFKVVLRVVVENLYYHKNEVDSSNAEKTHFN